MHIKDQVITKIEDYLKNRIMATYKIRFSSDTKSITLDEYYNMVNSGSRYFKFADKVKLNEQELDTIFKYVRQYLSSIELKNFPNAGSDSYFIYEVFKSISEQVDKDNENYGEIMKYLSYITCMASSLIDSSIEGKMTCVDGVFEARDYLGDIYVDSSNNYVGNYGAIIDSDNLVVIELEKDGSKIIDCTIDCGIYYDSCKGNYKYSKNFNVVPLNEYLESIGADFLFQPIYKNKKEINNMFQKLHNYESFVKLNEEYAKACANILFQRALDKTLSFNEEQKRIFIQLVSQGILKQLYLNNNYALIHNIYPESDILDEATNEARIRLKDGAIALEISQDNVDVSYGYAALKKVYKMGK